MISTKQCRLCHSALKEPSEYCPHCGAFLGNQDWPNFPYHQNATSKRKTMAERPKAEPMPRGAKVLLAFGILMMATIMGFAIYDSMDDITAGNHTATIVLEIDAPAGAAEYEVYFDTGTNWMKVASGTMNGTLRLDIPFEWYGQPDRTLYVEVIHDGSLLASKTISIKADKISYVSFS